MPKEKIWGKQRTETVFAYQLLSCLSQKELCTVHIFRNQLQKTLGLAGREDFPHGKSSVFEGSFIPHQIKSKKLSAWKNTHGIQLVRKKPVHSLLWHMRAEVLSPTLNPHLENFLHREDAYIISKKNIFRAPIARSEDSFIKSSLLNCHDLAQLPLLFPFPLLMIYFLPLSQTCETCRRVLGLPILQLLMRFPLSSFSWWWQAGASSLWRCA